MKQAGTRGSLIPWWLVIAAVAFAAVALLTLTGCAGQSAREHEEMHCSGYAHAEPPAGGVPFRYEWTKTHPASAKPWIYFNVADVDAVCRAQGADPYHRLAHIAGCAQWMPNGCTIYLQEGAQ